MKIGFSRVVKGIVALALAGVSVASAQSTYQPKFAGDPARSEAEAAALERQNNQDVKRRNRNSREERQAEKEL